VATWEGKFAGGPVERRLSLAAFVSIAKSALVPGFIFGVGAAEPPSADLAMKCGGCVARFVYRGNALTAPLRIGPGFCLILLLQHEPLHAKGILLVCGNFGVGNLSWARFWP